MTIQFIICLIVGILFSGSSFATEKGLNEIDSLPKDLEFRLALSALPPHLQEQATVYSLNPQKGFEMVRKGSNGFHAFVARNSPDVSKGSWPFMEYPSDVLIPIAFDNAGAEANMRPFFDFAKLQAQGLEPKKAKSIMKERYGTGFYEAPARAGISYMLSPVLRAYINPEKDGTLGTYNFPHYMFYAPNVSNSDIGGGQTAGSYPWAFRPGPHGYIVLRVGEKEIGEINKEYQELIIQLCELKKEFCLPRENGS